MRDANRKREGGNREEGGAGGPATKLTSPQFQIFLFRSGGMYVEYFDPGGLWNMMKHDLATSSFSAHEYC